MSPAVYLIAARRSATDAINPDLLRATQAYLVCLARCQPPTPSLCVAWDQFYRVCDPLIRRFAVTCRVPKADLNDCLQEVWIELVRALPDFRYDPGRGLFRSWLYTLVHSKATDLIRRRARRPTANLDRAAGAPLFERDADPAAECERRGLQETVQHVLARLRQQVSARSYLALYMGSIEGRTAVEVAAALGLTPGQVRLRQHRMRQKLRVLYGCSAGDG